MAKKIRESLLDALAGGLGLLVVIVPLLLEVWGIVWTFYRYGPGKGAVAVFVPPYAWYRGIAFFWDKAEWEENWDEMTASLGFILNDPGSIDSFRYIPIVHGWIGSLPSRKRESLHEAADAYVRACIGYYDAQLAYLLERSEAPQLNISVADIDAFKNVSGLSQTWRRLNEQEPMSQSIFDSLLANAGVDRKDDLTRETFASQRAQYVNVLKGTLDELFKEELPLPKPARSPLEVLR